MLVWTPRDGDRHVISMRKCNAREKAVSRRVWVDPDDAPEWTTDQFERAEIAVDGKLVSPTQGTLSRPRGRPKKPDAKMHINIRLSPQVLDFFRATGPGWQTRVDEVLRQWVSRHRKEPPARSRRNDAA
jgi:uncharacterized protein (DUF4415 family)